jgi:flagellar motor switch protein FliM
MLTFEIALLGTTGTMSICIPHPVLQPIIADLTSQVWSSGAAPTADTRAALDQPEQLDPVALPLTVELGETELLVRDLLALTPGEVIKLDAPASGDLRVCVGGHPKFTGRPGVVGRNLAIQITRTCA